MAAPGLLAGHGAPSAVAHPGHGAREVTVDGDAFRFDPVVVQIGTNDTVIWRWEGAAFRNHSVTADPGQAESFDSDPAAPPDANTHPPGDTFAHAFSQPGIFSYHCKVHPSMRGEVEVVELNPGTGARPRISDLRVSPQRVCAGAGKSCSRRTPRTVFRVSRGGDVIGRIARRHDGRWRGVDSFTAVVYAGKNRVRIPTANLQPGVHRLSLRAYDAADRRSPTARARFRVV